MLRRFTKVFYSILSICVAIACVGVLTLTAAAFTLEGEGNRTDFTVNSLSVCAITENDPNLPCEADASQWCCVVLNVTADTWDFSPYTYTFDSVLVKTRGRLQNTENAFVVLTDPVSYSRANPQDFELRVYLHVPPDMAAAELVGKLSFTATSATKSLGAITEDMKMYLPKLDMTQQQNYQITDNTEPAARSAAGSFFDFILQRWLSPKP